MLKKFSHIFLVLFLATTISACSLLPNGPLDKQVQTAEPTQIPQNIETTQQEIQPITMTAEQDEINAFELLKSGHEVSAKQYDFGEFIEEIDNVKNTEKNYWALYVNGEYAQVGADQTILQKGDMIEFRYEAIQQ